MSLIEVIVADTTAVLEHTRTVRPLRELKRRLLDAPPVRSLRAALSTFGLITEIKERSPSVGAMSLVNVREAPRAYEESPAVVAISVLTQGTFFGGSIERLSEIRRASAKPILRKDFIFDEYQVYEARAFGADAILLMPSLPVFEKNPARIELLFDLATSLGLECLCEIGMTTGNELPRDVAARVPRRAILWGANSRQFTSSKLRFRQRVGRLLGWDLMIDIRRHAALRELIPEGKIAIAESGIHTQRDLEAVAAMGFSGALIGTALLRGPRSVRSMLDAFTAAVDRIRAKAWNVAASDTTHVSARAHSA